MRNLLNQLPLMIIVTIIFGIVYVVGQQNLRQNANFPQVQLVEDAVAALQNNESLATNVLGNNVDIAKSLSPYIVVYNDAGQAAYGSGFLNSRLADLPAGVFNDAKNRELRFTWQPESLIREAVVIAAYKNDLGSGFVMAGRSLREVEIQETNLLMQVAVGWFFTIIVVIAAPYFPHYVAQVEHWYKRRKRLASIQK